MFKKFTIGLASAGMLLGGMSAYAVDDASVLAVNGIAETITTDITSILTTNLPIIALIVVIIFGTMLAVKLVKRFVK